MNEAASTPPPGLDGLDPGWSRIVTARVGDTDRTFHVLDNQTSDPDVTLLCVHGNPSWSYLWRHVIAAAPPSTRVIAVDQLDMGFSERTGTTRRLAQRIDDLTAVVNELDVAGPVVTVAHDWGGPVSLGWVARNRHRCVGVVLTNTAVHQPAGSPAPSIIRLARQRAVRRIVCVETPAFITGALRMSRPRPPKPVRDGYLAPYLTPGRREAIATFVEDIPLEPDHPSAETLDAVAASLDQLAGIPVLLAWGASDPVFSDLYLRDLQTRLPHAETHRYPGRGHFVHEETDVATPIHAWVQRILAPPPSRDRAEDRSDRPPIWDGIERRATDSGVAVRQMAARKDDPRTAISFTDLWQEVNDVARGLIAQGIAPGDRVALMIPPGIDLTVALYACWRAGTTVVLVDSALGLRHIRSAVTSANPKHIIGIPEAITVARATAWPGDRWTVRPLDAPLARTLGVRGSLDEIRAAGAASKVDVPLPDDEADAVVAFTSGSTGPSKGVVYRHHQLQAQRDALRSTTGTTSEDRLTAAFAPFALFAPALGIASVVPDMEVTSPGSLTAAALADACAAVDATLAFASPAALANVVDTAASLTEAQRAALGRIRLLLSAGAPVNTSLLRRAAALTPNAEAATPYGMTELLPAAWITLAELDRLEVDAASAGTDEPVMLDSGVCVGRAVEGVLARIAPFGAPDTLSREPGVAGEIVLRAPHAKDRYDQLWATQLVSEQPIGWHRTGDIGHLDQDGRLWVEGRMVHAISAEDAIVTPVGVELAAESVEAVRRAAAVGIGEPGRQVVAVVVETTEPTRRPSMAPTSLVAAVRAAVAERTGTDVVAVLCVPELPTDKRHNSKIDRTRVGAWAEQILAGGRIGRL